MVWISLRLRCLKHDNSASRELYRRIGETPMTARFRCQPRHRRNEKRPPRLPSEAGAEGNLKHDFYDLSRIHPQALRTIR
jgi:hypothetical protein